MDEYFKEKDKRIAYGRKEKKILRIFVLSVIFLIFGIYIFDDYFRPVKVDERIDKNSIHYATDLYYSDGRYYDKYLNKQEKKFYLKMFKDLKKVKKKTAFKYDDYQCNNFDECFQMLVKVYDVILMEHPDLFWYRVSQVEEYDDTTFVVRHDYVTTNKFTIKMTKRKLLRRIDELAKKLRRKNDYDTIKRVYTWLGKDKDYSFLITRKDGTAWSALLSDDSVCAGFAAASQLLFQRLNIDSMLVVGNTTDAHAWNFVKLDDGYYWYDSTVGGSLEYEDAKFYDGLFFENIDYKYNVSIIDLGDINFGSKYIER